MAKGLFRWPASRTSRRIFGELQKTIESMTSLLSDKKHEDDDLAGPVGELRTKLEAWLKKKG